MITKKISKEDLLEVFEEKEKYIIYACGGMEELVHNPKLKPCTCMNEEGKGGEVVKIVEGEDDAMEGAIEVWLG